MHFQFACTVLYWRSVYRYLIPSVKTHRICSNPTGAKLSNRPTQLPALSRAENDISLAYSRSNAENLLNAYPMHFRLPSLLHEINVFTKLKLRVATISYSNAFTVYIRYDDIDLII